MLSTISDSNRPQVIQTLFTKKKFQVNTGWSRKEPSVTKRISQNFARLMEGKRHASTAHQTNGEISRMQQDFQVCSQTFSSTPEKRLATREKHLVDQKRKRVSTNRPLRPIRVGIVGGGLAGLRSAEVLLSEGCEVTILEGRDRLGGRVSVIDCYKQSS